MAVSAVTIIVGNDPSMVLNDPGGFPGMWPDGFTMEVRDPDSGAWLEVGDLSAGARFEIDDPGSAMSPSGRMEVRITGTDVDLGFGQNTFFVTAEVEGVIAE
jgi:hypothetical protein